MKEELNKETKWLILFQYLMINGFLIVFKIIIRTGTKKYVCTPTYDYSYIKKKYSVNQPNC